MSLPRHHLEDDLLLDYAAGAASEAVGLVVACHLTLCTSCRARLAAAERVGGALLEAAPGTALSPDALSRLWSRIDGAGAEGDETTVPSAAISDPPASRAAASRVPLMIDGVT